MGFRNTETRLHRPETGKPLTRSWTDAVTNNLNHESTTPGGFSEGPNLNPSHPSPYINPVTLRVKNHTNAPQEMFSVLKITTPEETNPNAFPHVLRSQQNAIYGETPTGDCHESVAITTYYMDPETELPCIVSGPSPVKILFETEESLTFPFAIPIYGDTTKLKASPFGRIKILWHEETQQTPTCSQPIVLYSWVNLGIQCEWSFWKLKADLACCSGALAQLCDECGAVINEDCPIEAMIYAPPGQTLCSCEDSCAMWKAGDIVPALWYEYLCKWVTIPNFNINLEEKEMQVVTSLTLTGGTVTPATEYQTVVTDIVIDTEKITLCNTVPEEVYCLSGEITLENATASGNITVTGSIGTQANPIKLDVVSDCEDVTIADGSITSTGNASLTGSLSGSASVSVPLDGVSLPVSGTCSGTASGTVNVSGNAHLYGTCEITSTLPTLEVTGAAVVTGAATLSGTITQTGNAVTLSGGTAKTVVTGASLTAPSLSTTAVNLSIPAATGTVTGTLSNSSTTNVSLSGNSVSLDLSSLFEEVDMVDPSTFSFTGCTLTWTTKKCLALKSGVSLSSLSAALSGSIAIPSAVTGTSDHSSNGTTATINSVSAWSAGSLSTTTGSVTIPTTVTLDETKLAVSGTGTMSTTGTVTGTATFPTGTTLTGVCEVSGTVSSSGSASLPVSGTISGTASGSSGSTATGTASITDTITVSGPLSVSSGVSISGKLSRSCPQYVNVYIPSVSLSTSSAISLPVSGTISDTRVCYVDMPQSICCEEGWFDVEQARVPFPSVDLTGATISGTTSTIKYVACADCPETEEEGEEEE